MSEPKLQTGVELIAAERQRQIEVEGWSPEHDDDHDDNSMVWAAIAYAAPTMVAEIVENQDGLHLTHDVWPSSWSRAWDKRERNQFGKIFHAATALPADRYIRRLVKAGALIAAEIDRLQRADLATTQRPKESDG